MPAMDQQVSLLLYGSNYLRKLFKFYHLVLISLSFNAKAFRIFGVGFYG